MISRRGLLFGSIGAATLASLPRSGHALPPEPPGRFRFVHMTDLHMRPGNGAPEGISLAVKKVLELDPRPDFVITGGDSLEGMMAADAGRMQRMASMLEEALRPLEMPIHHAVGNHDVFGWSRVGQPTSPEPGYGKSMFIERFVGADAFREVRHKGVVLLVLDPIQFDAKVDRKYRVDIDDDQLTWMKGRLEAAGKQTPIIVVTHVPLLSTYHLINEGAYQPIASTMVLENGKEVHELLKPYNVKLVLQGHTHIMEDVLYAGRRHITSGAVCGSWWSGKRFGVDPEGFSVIDVNGDSLSWRYVPTGWQARTS